MQQGVVTNQGMLSASEERTGPVPKAAVPALSAAFHDVLRQVRSTIQPSFCCPVASVLAFARSHVLNRGHNALSTLLEYLVFAGAQTAQQLKFSTPNFDIMTTHTDEATPIRQFCTREGGS